MNAEQYLERIENKRLNSTPLYSRKEMIDFAEKYVKQLNIPVVVLQSEQFSLTDIYKLAQGYKEEEFIKMVKHLQG